MTETHQEWAAKVNNFVIPAMNEDQARSLAAPAGVPIVRDVTDWRVADE